MTPVRPAPTPLALLLLPLLALPLSVQGAAWDGPEGPVEAPLLNPQPERPLPIEEVRRYVGVWRTVQEAYVEEVDDRRLMEASIRGLLSDLDPHSAYLDREQTESMQERSAGAYDGIGVELQQLPDRSLLVIAPIDDTPAARAGVLAGDVITRIDGEPVAVDSVDEAVSLLRGEPGSAVQLTVLREGEVGPLELTVVRERIRVESVRHRLLEPGFGYVRISTFQADTAHALQDALEALEAEAETDGTGLSGLVLDLRSNPGGLLNVAVEASDLFLDEGLIVSTRGRLPFANAEFHASPGQWLEGVEIVVLIDSGTASAAEVMAGALRDHGRARLMGNRSFGKGSVQTLLPLENGDSLKLTTARYYTPSGNTIQARGLRPDLPVTRRAMGARRNFRESDLPGHLGRDAGAAEDGLDELDEDRVIRLAVDALKAGSGPARAPSAQGRAPARG